MAVDFLNAEAELILNQAATTKDRNKATSYLIVQHEAPGQVSVLTYTHNHWGRTGDDPATLIQYQALLYIKLPSGPS